jgi:hypothetical protein
MAGPVFGNVPGGSAYRRTDWRPPRRPCHRRTRTTDVDPRPGDRERGGGEPKDPGPDLGRPRHSVRTRSPLSRTRRRMSGRRGARAAWRCGGPRPEHAPRNSRGGALERLPESETWRDAAMTATPGQERRGAQPSPLLNRSTRGSQAACPTSRRACGTPWAGGTRPARADEGAATKVASPDRARARHVVPGSRDELGVGGRGDRSVWPVVLVSPRPFFGTGGPSRCGWRTRPRSRRAVYDVCTG